MRPLLAALLLFLASSSHAGYFRLIDPTHVYKIAGAAVDPVNPGQTSFVSEIALITHSTKDGTILPKAWADAGYAENWSPLMVGPSYNAGRFAVVFGPAMNLAPATKALLLSAVNAATKPESWPFVKGMLAPSKDGVTVSFGPQMKINPIDHGVILPLNQWDAQGRIFAGAALAW